LAIELTKPGIRATKERLNRDGQKAALVVADAQHLPLREDSVDTTWTSLLLHHFPQLGALPDELARITRRRLIAFEPNAQNPLSWMAFNVVNPIVGLSTTTRNQRSLWPGRLKRAFRRVGLETEALEYIHRPWTDAPGVMGFIRKVFTVLTSPLPLRFRANKFLIIFDKKTP
jgi:SAM-dependent methyltransferase